METLKYPTLLGWAPDTHIIYLAHELEYSSGIHLKVSK